MALGRTAKYYRDNPEARKKHRDYQKKYNKKKSSIRQRVADNRENRRFGTYGNYDGLDVSRRKGGKYVLESAKKNRGSKTNTPGDKRARGKKGKGRKNKGNTKK
tara:strand:+ start:4193 stop:4504 length:312 start_codon:yes stop_codon:yes gene_type:complete